MTDTTSAPTTVPPATVITESWLKVHERLVIIAVGALLLLYIYSRGLSAWEAHDQRIASKAAQVVQIDAVNNKDLTAQLTQLKATTDQQNAALNLKIQSELTQLQKQQQQDAAATQQQILDRWKLLLPLKPGAVTAVNGVDQLTPDAANQTVQALEQIPILQSEVHDLNTKILADDAIIGKQDDLIVGLDKQILDETAKNAADVKLLNVKVRHAWMSGFKWGLITGVVGAEVLRTMITKQP